MTGPFFVDTNVLVYARDPSDPHKQRRAASWLARLWDDLAALATWSPVPTDLEVMESAWRVEDRFGFSWWDALIVAQALASGCEAILTEELQHGQDLFGVRVVNPFQVDP